MASKRMSISALLSSDSKPPKHAESSHAQQSSSQPHPYPSRTENESMQDVDAFRKRSNENLSAESRPYSSSTISNPGASTAWYSQVDSRVSPVIQETRFPARPSHNFPSAPEPSRSQAEQEHSRPYYHSSPLYNDRYPDREQSTDSKPLPLAQAQPSYTQHIPTYPPFRQHTSEYRERDSRQSFSSSSRPKNISHTDTSDSLLSVLTRTAASEGVGLGSNHNATTVKFSSSPPLQLPSTLSRRDPGKEVERDRIQVDRKREVIHPQDSREYQRSPFLNAERHNAYHYLPDQPQTSETQMLRARPDSRGIPAHSTTTNYHAAPSQNPSKSQPLQSNPVANQYPQTFSSKVQPPHPPSHAPYVQHPSHLETHNPPSSNPISRSLAMPPRLDLTLPLSLSPATIQSQMISPISPHYSTSNFGAQTPSRSAHYSHTVSSSRGTMQSKEHLTPQNAVGKSSNPATFLPLRNQAVPQPADPHPPPISQPSVSKVPSPTLHPPSFILPLRPFSPQQPSSSIRVSEPVASPRQDPNKDFWEKNARHARIPGVYLPRSNLDTDAIRRNSEKNITVPKRPTSYDQRRVDESRMGIAEVVSEKTKSRHSTSTPSKVPYPQERDSVLSNDRGFRLWNNGPVIENKVSSPRKDIDTRHSTINMDTKLKEELNSYPNRSRQEESLALISTLPLKTLPVPNLERQQGTPTRINVHTGEKDISRVSSQSEEDKEKSLNLPKVASPKLKSPSIPYSRVNILNPEPRSLSHTDAHLKSPTEMSVRTSGVSAPSPMARSAVLQRSPRVEIKDTRSFSQVNEDNRAASPPKRGRTASPSLLLSKQSSHSPHLSGTDTMSSTKNSEAELHHPSPSRPLPPALPGAVPILYDSIQYPLPLPARVATILLDNPGPERSPVPADNETGQHPSTQSAPLQPTETLPSLGLAQTAWPEVTTVADISSQETLDVDSDLQHDVEMNAASEELSVPSEERHEHHIEKEVMEDEFPVTSFQPEKDSPTSDFNNKHHAEVAGVSSDTNIHSLPSPAEAPTPQSLLETKDKQLSSQTIESPKDPPLSPLPSPPVGDRLPLSTCHQSIPSPKSGGETLPLDEQPTDDTEKSKRGERLSAPASDVEQPPEVLDQGDPRQEDVKIINSPEIEIPLKRTEANVSTETAVFLSGVGPSEAPVQPSDEKPSVLEENKRGDEDTVDVDMMDVGLNDGPVPSLQMDDRSLEDELLSLVDDKPDIKPKPVTESLVPPTVSSAAPSRKTFGSKVKPPKPRTQGKQTKSKSVRPDSETLTPSSPIAGNNSAPGSSSKSSGRSNKAVSGSRKKTGNVGSTARSVSVMPEPTPDPTPAPAEERLYCVCNMPYDEDKVMIACDRCDEWYHPSCVSMPEQDIDLVDQFICAKCKKVNPGLKTTYKTRCYRGTHYISDYDKMPPCWKAAKGPFSKYCSDACGIAHMRAKIAQSGKDLNELWPLVRHAKKREGVTVEYLYDGSNVSKKVKLENGERTEFGEGKLAKPSLNGFKTGALNTKVHTSSNGDKARLAAFKHSLATVRSSKDKFKLELEYVTTRRRLLDLAVERASDKFCGWDTRLEMGDHEWAAWIICLEGKKALYGNQDDEEDDDDDDDNENGERKMLWLCHGPVECPRHHGWKTVRDLELQMEVDFKNGSIKQLSETERELKRKIEELLPTPRSGKKVKKGIR